MQCPRQMPQHRAQPLWIGDAARQITKLVTDVGELAQEARRGRACREQATPKILVMLDDVIELAERVLAGNLSWEARTGLAAIALEGCDGGMLVLDLAGDRAERPVGDMPGDGAAELASAEMPGPCIGTARDRRCARRAIPAIEMIAELVERAHNLAGKVILGRRAALEHDPKAVDAAPGTRRSGELFQHGHGAADGLRW